jgi:NAD(P)-dependent dehydrogenase (short-subunit alcohol dehydrogenase family)
MDFTGKVALVTGAANGIGRATALGFANYGAKVVLVDRDGAGASAAAGAIKQQGGEAISVQADVTKAADVANYVKAAVDAFGRIDCFHNNAGVEGLVKPIYDYDDEVYDQLMAVNVKGVFLGLKHVTPVMIKQRGGAIVNTASISGLGGGPTGAGRASPHGGRSLSRPGPSSTALRPARTSDRRSTEGARARRPPTPRSVHLVRSATT